MFVFPAKKFVWLTSSILPRPLFIRIWDCISVYMRGGSQTGESIGLIRFTPWEAVVVAADVAMKGADLDWIYGSLLRFPHFNRRSVTGTDCGGRSRSIFS